MVLSTLKSNLRKGRWLFVFMIVVIILAAVCERKNYNRKYSRNDVERFKQVLHDKEKMAEAGLLEIKESLKDGGKDEVYASLINRFALKYRDEGISFYVYKNDSLIIWTNNTFSCPDSPQKFKGENFINLYNAWFLKDSLKTNEFSIFSLILIRTEFPFENRVVKNGFQEKFRLSPDVQIIYPGFESSDSIYSKDGEYLFSLDYSNTRGENRFEFTICLILYILGFFIFLSFLRNFLHNSPKKYKNYLFVLVTLILLSLYYLLHYYRIPVILFNLELFSPGKFARSPVLPSLGDLTILIVFGFFIIYNFYLEVNFSQTKLNKSGALRLILGLFTGIIIVFLYFIKTFLVRSLILDSSIAFEAYKVLDLSIYTYLGFSLIALVLTSYSILIDKIFGLFLKLNRRGEIIIFLICINLAVFAIYLIPGSGIYLESPIFFLLISLILYYIRILKKLEYRFSTFVVFALFFSIYTVIEVVRLTEIKARGDMRIFAVNLSTEHDPVAELLFVDISRKLKDDNQVKNILFRPNIDFDILYEEIQHKYFSGYLGKFDLQLTICKPEDNVFISPPEDAWYPCYDFFYNHIMKYAFQVANTEFYYLDNMNGRISYFSALKFEENGEEITAFIELDSKLLSEGLGYPVLLLEDKFINKTKNEYSYAKYNQGKLIASAGLFSYRMTRDSYTDGTEGFFNLEIDGFDHVIYNLDRENTIIVTKRAVFLIDILISFSYIFGFYFFVLVIILLLTGINPIVSAIQWNFKNKIQFAMSAVLFISLIFIGSGTVYYSIMQYKNKHNDNLKEKLQSLYVELIHKLEFEQDLQTWSSDNYYDLEKLLQKFSNVFYTDINLYDENGWLLATSRPEIFDKGLIGRNMDAIAYMEMAYNRRSEFIHNENIGELAYLSAYVPFVNSENKLLAYLNLPYFTRQDELTTEIANLVVAIMNIFVLLTLLILTLAVFMANTITQPLRMIQEHISRFRLTENNEKINYNGRDEIGSLINEYNKMIDQLEESAELLARSERESAWREMAKQIAHEIKNPLTPMRLIVQHIQRAWKDNEEPEQQFEKLSKILLEQIDNLSNIATEFSNFAKMPAARNEKVNMVMVIQDILRLFSKTDNIEFVLNTDGRKEYNVWADREQLSRVFINLLKNAIQSIPEGNSGLIEIGIKVNNEKLVISIRDNGRGISEDIRDRLFQPNFTTKTSGMGMGLAIAKNIINTAGGNINYETELNTGTLFIVELPVLIE